MDGSLLNGLFNGLAIIGASIMVLFFIIGFLLGHSDICSEELIKPEIEIIVEDNIIDTLYIYRRP